MQAVCDRSPGANPRRVVLLHRSDQCNHATKVKRVFASDPRFAVPGRVLLTEQRRRSRWIRVPPMRTMVRSQLLLAG